MFKAADNLKGKRKKQRDPCPNPLFMQWLTEWRDDAAAKGMKSQYTYNKALVSLKKFPVKLSSGKECKLLENFGDKICKMLDDKLQEYIAQYGTTEPVDGYLTIAIARKTTKRTKTQLKKHDNQMRLSPLPPDGAVRKRSQNISDSETCDVGLEQNDCYKTERTSSLSRMENHESRDYRPQERSGSYAILVTLFNNEVNGGYSHMNKADLIKQAQPLASKCFTVADPGSRYTSWSSMATLIKKGFVNKQNSPAQYSLTSSGRALAERLVLEERSHVVAAVYGTEMFTVTEGESIHHQKASVINDITELSDDNYSDHVNKRNEDDVRSESDNHQGGNCVSSCLQFTYIDVEGNEVPSRDKAVHSKDDSVEFLIKCKYVDLLMSGMTYRLDTTRHSEDESIFAFITAADAPEFSTLSVQSSDASSGNKITELSTSQLIATKNSSLPKDNANKSTSLNHKHSQLNVISDKTDSNCQQYSFSKLKSKLLGVKSCSGIKADSIPQDNPPVPFSRGESQSERDILCDITGNIRSKEKCVLKPGDFEIILCVDNQEFYGGGKKDLLVKELTRNGVPHHIRSLNIGDFCWIAQHKTEKIELVLDYVVERKRMDDLAASIIDGRFKEQKFRLKSSGIHHGIYLVEDYGSNQHFSIAEDALFQAITNTQIIDNFYVKRTGNTLESAIYLSVMTRYLQNLFSNKILYAVSKSQLEKIHQNRIHDFTNKEMYLMNFDEFNQASVKTKVLSVKEMFGKQLCQLHGLTADKAVAILERYPTPNRLFKAYSSCVNDKEKEMLLSNVKFGQGQRNIGMALSRNIYHMYNTTGNV